MKATSMKALSPQREYSQIFFNIKTEVRNNYHALPTRLAFQEQIGRFTFETRHRLNQTFEARLAQLQEEMSQVTFRTPNRPTLTTNQTRNITMLNNYFRNMSAFTVIGDDIIFELPEQFSTSPLRPEVSHIINQCLTITLEICQRL